jgi:hypothetical protein
MGPSKKPGTSRQKGGVRFNGRLEELWWCLAHDSKTKADSRLSPPLGKPISLSEKWSSLKSSGVIIKLSRFSVKCKIY